MPMIKLVCDVLFMIMDYWRATNTGCVKEQDVHTFCDGCDDDGDTNRWKSQEQNLSRLMYA